MTTGMVIVHYNDLESLTDLINNVKDYKMLDKIIIVDNNSKKEIKTKLKELTNSKIELIEKDLMIVEQDMLRHDSIHLATTIMSYLMEK